MVDVSNPTPQAEAAQPLVLSPAEAFIGIALTATAVDGLLSVTEQQALVLSIYTMPVFTTYSQEELAAAMDRMTELLTQRSLDEVVQAASDALSPPLRETAFYMAVEMALADYLVSDNEKLLLKHLQQKLGIDGETAAKIGEVVLIRNRR